MERFNDGVAFDRLNAVELAPRRIVAVAREVGGLEFADRALAARVARSLTCDRGKETSAHAQFKVETGIPVFIADPQAPWQRGTNENTNGLLRQYFPKGTDLSRWAAEDLEAVVHALNTRPRKTLGWKTPRRHSTSTYCCSNKPVLLPLVEFEQFTSWVFGDKIRSAGLLPSFGTVGDGLDNAMMESFWSSMQIELLNRRRWKTRVELAKAIFEYIEIFHNRRRRHSALGYRTPIEYEMLGKHDANTAVN